MAVARARGLAAGLLVVLAACSDEGLVIRPVIDVPTDDVDATASMLDTISLKVAHAKDDSELVAHNFQRGEALEIGGVPFGDDLVIHMIGSIEQSPIAYGRTCAIQVEPDAAPPTPHLFFSRIVKFANLDISPVPRIGGVGFSYQGAALLVGGRDDAGLVAEAERFDPMTGQLSTIGTVVTREHAAHALFGTSPPRALVIGGMNSGGGVEDIEVFDSSGMERLDVAGMGRIDLTATALTSGRVIVTGGRPPGGAPVGEIDEIVEANASIDVVKLNLQLAVPRSGHTATRLGDDIGAPVLIAGGVDGGDTPVALAELFKPLSEELANPAMFSPHMVYPRQGHSATLMPDGSVLFLGGLDALGPVRKLELFSLDRGFVDTLAVLPDSAGSVDFATITLPDGRILLTGGRTRPGMPPLDTAYIFRLDPLNGKVEVVATDHMAIARAGHQAVLLCDGSVLITGGAPPGFAAERYNPPPPPNGLR